MPLAVLPVQIADVEPVYDVFFEAFKDEPIMKFLYPGGIDRKAHAEATIQWWNQDTTSYTVKCVDTETGEIVGMSTWEVFWRPAPEERWHKPTDIPWLEGEEKTQCLRVVGPMWDVREELFGRQKYIYLASIAVHPDQQRRGAGRLLLQWGVDMSEQLGIPIYTEASESGLGLYVDAGFERLTHVGLVHRAEVIGGSADVEVPLVVRLTKDAHGLKFKEWAEMHYQS
ncbi:hypothetical protein FE257_000431 [Aspergillus nanangensis]|uniref:N-acetyltransferase domain-containing protein n=1 Tax=Aspergillus nanangensis TaxID=2582783 RepID=A0AAD4GXC6_ASPNN|nr:hypothetical protein FE257_000431 [Aspergillus nanangensis]